MKNHTTPQTAFRLKAAGFPQPKPEFGQVWATETMYQFSVDSDWGLNGVQAYFPDATGRKIVRIDTSAYCPSIQDFLEQMPGAVIKTTGGHYGLFFNEGSSDEIVFTDANLLEACALAWLSIQKNNL